MFSCILLQIRLLDLRRIERTIKFPNKEWEYYPWLLYEPVEESYQPFFHQNHDYLLHQLFYMSHFEEYPSSLDRRNNFPDNFQKSYENSEKEKERILAEESKLSQIWYTLNKPENKKQVEELLIKHFRNLYPDVKFPLEILWNVTMYTEGCFIEEHIDGRDTDRMAGFLFYLN